MFDEATEPDLNWVTATASAGGECVEVAVSGSSVFVRDSKDPSETRLQYTHPEWRAFLSGVKAGEFDLR